MEDYANITHNGEIYDRSVSAKNIIFDSTVIFQFLFLKCTTDFIQYYHTLASC